MNKKTSIIVIAILLVAGVISLFFSFPKPEYLTIDLILRNSFMLAGLVGFYLLLCESDIQKRWYWWVILLGQAILMVGALFKIQHWPFVPVLMFTGSILIIITYLFRFIKKEKKGRNDILKLIWIVSAYTVIPLYLMNLIPKEYSYISSAFFGLTLADFIITDYRKNRWNEVSEPKELKIPQ